MFQRLMSLVVVSGEKNLEKCLSLYQKSKKCLSEGGFNLRKWISNSPQLLELICEDQTRIDENSLVMEDTESYAKTTMGHLEKLDMKNEHKVLGLNWDCVSDEFIFKFEALLKLAEGLERTRRNLLKITSSFFDPLGVLSPVLVQMKVLFQMLCQEKFDWDALLPEPARREWMRWLQDLQEVQRVLVPRCVYAGLEEEIVSCTIHGFGDASEKAYCAVVYLVLEASSGYHPVLLSSKTRVAPLSKQSIPRLELLSGVILARLVSSVKETLEPKIQINETHLWLDSKTAIFWIKGSKEWKQFVQNRVNEIRSLTEESMWNHCPGLENPADIGSRGEVASKLKSNQLWWRGPWWLSEPKTNWPKFEECLESITEECRTELKKAQALEATEETVLLASTGRPDLEACIPITDFSCSDKLFRITALVLRFVRNLKIKTKMSKEETVCEGDLTVEEVVNAETQWLRSVQKNMKSQANYSQLEREFGVYEDDSGVLRCKGRIANADLPLETKFPALLPRDHHISTLLVRQAHERVHHNKVEATLAQLRTRYWIIRGRQFVKKILASCTVCRRYEGRGYRVPPQGDLPEFRLSQKPAFTYVGVDYAGPLYTKESNHSELQKVYVLLFTCCSTRAIHLELATDMSADTFIRCLRRLTARRGTPEIIVSDNAKTFKSAAKVLRKVFSYPSVKRFIAGRRITWRFNVDRAPWWGGFFERMIQNVKRCLRKTLRNARLNYDELHTILVEVEGTLNSRPLTYVSSDDPEEPLTPSHLMYGRRILSLPDVGASSQDSINQAVSSEDLPRRRRYLGLLLQHFWKRWSREYVTELRNLHRQRSRPESRMSISVGDVVTVFEDNLPRSQWRLGRVEQLIPGADNCVRAAVIKVITKSGRPMTVKRPVQKLFPLEIVTHDEQLQDEARRPRRAAAINADYIRRLVDQ